MRTLSHHNSWKQREKQRLLAAKALMGMVAGQDSILTQTVLTAWREQAVRERRDREQQDREVAFAAEVRRHRERHQELLQGCMAKWGSESSSVLQSTVFGVWREAMERTRQLRKHAEKVLLDAECPKMMDPGSVAFVARHTQASTESI